MKRDLTPMELALLDIPTETERLTWEAWFGDTPMSWLWPRQDTEAEGAVDIEVALSGHNPIR